MMRLSFVIILIGLLASCRSTKKIQTAITKKDTAQVTHTTVKTDTTNYIRTVMQSVSANRIDFKTFSAKVNVDYRDADNRDYNLNAFVRIYKDSLIWISVNSILGEALRVYITKDSVKLLDKQNKKYIARGMNYIQSITSLPFDFQTLQDVIVGNPAFIDSNIVSYGRGNNLLTISSVNNYYKSLTTFQEADKVLLRTKVDDVDIASSRTADFTYSDYDHSAGMNFPTKRTITVVGGKGHLDIGLDFKKYDMNPASLSTPFSIPRNYKKG
jgi:hypothetical protein